jgi:deferrochelatase/peroxidase EfeB
MSISMRRRRFLAGIATGALSVGVGACSASPALVPVEEIAEPHPNRPSGNHQAGVTTIPPAAASLAALDLTRAGHKQLHRLLELLTSRIRDLQLRSSGSSGVTVTVAVGASLFDKHRDLARLRPRRLIAMPTFPNDVLNPAWCHGDLLVQVCAERPSTARDTVGGSCGVLARWSSRAGRLLGFGPRTT